MHYLTMLFTNLQMLSKLDQILYNQHFPRRYNHFKSYNQNTDFAFRDQKVKSSNLFTPTTSKAKRIKHLLEIAGRRPVSPDDEV